MGTIASTLGRMAQAEEIAGVVAFLAEPGARYMTPRRCPRTLGS
jgi:NAD(P)-dependent dehydrogenase (short-subunit alcohol dehydrogenase family)